MTVRTNPFIYIFNKAGQKSLTLFEPFKKRYFQIKDIFLFDLLEFSRIWRSKEEIIGFISSFWRLKNREASELLFNNLLEQNLLINKENQINKIFKVSKYWFENGWHSPFYYHLTSRDFQFLDYSRRGDILNDRTLMKKYSKFSLPPSIYKTYKNCKLYKLPKISEQVFKKIKLGLSNERNLKLNKQKLSRLLYLTFGETGSIHLPVLGRSLLKTSPSGGARHPTEAYVFIIKNIGFPKGVYHYSVKEHGLELINEQDCINSVNEVFFQLNHFPEFRPHAVIVMSSIFERSMWRYREPRSFRVILFDIGHLLATLKIVSQALGLDVLIGHGFDDKKVTEILRFKTAKERPFYFAAIGNFQREAAFNN